eukprot:2103746-Amphidinium_carterae.1
MACSRLLAHVLSESTKTSSLQCSILNTDATVSSDTCWGASWRNNAHSEMPLMEGKTSKRHGV